MTKRLIIARCFVSVAHNPTLFHDTHHVLLLYTRDLQPVKKLPCAVPDFVTFTSGHFETSHKKTARNSSGNTGLNISYTPSLFHLLTSYTPTSFDTRHSHRASQTHRGRTGPSYPAEKPSPGLPTGSRRPCRGAES